MFTRAGMPSQGNLHCARRYRAVGEQLGAMSSRCDCAALGAALLQASARGGYYLIVWPTPTAQRLKNVPTSGPKVPAGIAPAGPG